MTRPLAALTCLVALLLPLARPAPAQFDLNALSRAPAPASPVTAKATIDRLPLLPGTTGQIAIELTIARPYHVQSAQTLPPFIPARLTPKPAPGITFDPVRYPVPHTIPAPPGLPGITTLSVYDGKQFLLLPFRIDHSATPGPLTLDLSLITQACDDKSCLPPKTIPLSLPITIAPPGTEQKESDPALFQAATAQPYAADTPPPATAPVTITPTDSTPHDYANIKPLTLDQQLALIAERPYAPANHSELDYPLWMIICFALVGGFILNVMPCVLPVIPLKAMSLIQQAHGDRRLAVIHALVFSAGVISLFVALAIVLRTFGLFYGQQFQSPAFLVAMAMFVVALSLSMLGVWTINPPNALYAAEANLAGHTGGSGYLGSFANGLMATLLATPCSAPYLGPVLAWALVQPTWLTALALALVGVGMSLPYLILAAFPQLLNRVPRTGRWSELLKQALGIIMVGVAVYLITLIPNVQLWPAVMLGAVLVALVCWAWGQLPSASMSLSKIWTIRTAAVLIGIALGGVIYAVGTNNSRIVLNQQPEGQWQPFNIALLDAALADNRPVVVDWTANWCINCRVLEAAVLNKTDVQNAFTSQHALLLKADLSEDNPPASALNRKLGGEAIPVLAIFAPSKPHNPTVLRDSYTQTRVIEELKKSK